MYTDKTNTCSEVNMKLKTTEASLITAQIDKLIARRTAVTETKEYLREQEFGSKVLKLMDQYEFSIEELRVLVGSKMQEVTPALTKAVRKTRGSGVVPVAPPKPALDVPSSNAGPETPTIAARDKPLAAKPAAKPLNPNSKTAAAKPSGKPVTKTAGARPAANKPVAKNATQPKPAAKKLAGGKPKSAGSKTGLKKAGSKSNGKTGPAATGSTKPTAQPETAPTV